MSKANAEVVFFQPKLSQRSFKPVDVETLHVSVVITADVAIGCPFGGEERGGRVLIYNGHHDVAAQGLMLSQELRAARSRAGGLSGYGFTLRGGQDLDNNLYPGKYAKHISRSLCFPQCSV